MPNPIQDKEQFAELSQRQCEYCQYFRQDEYTGYCQFHHAHVIKTFVCDKFVYRGESREG